ncbi:MAG: hypothetical protein HYV07_21560 [Deltaproteobacteria bacterium]|nr:hypothetical protein [Deltaproteobacteria bacterium]
MSGPRLDPAGLRILIAEGERPEDEEPILDRARKALGALGKRPPIKTNAAANSVLQIGQNDHARRSDLALAGELDQAVRSGETVRAASRRIAAKAGCGENKPAAVRNAWRAARVILAHRRLAAQVDRGEPIDDLTCARIAIDLGIGSSPRKLARLAEGVDFEVQFLAPVEIPVFTNNAVNNSGRTDPPEPHDQWIRRMDSPEVKAVQSRLSARFGCSLQHAVLIGAREDMRVVEDFFEGNPHGTWGECDEYLNDLWRAGHEEPQNGQSSRPLKNVFPDHFDHLSTGADWIILLVFSWIIP